MPRLAEVMRVLALLLILTGAGAQPFVAGGGFDRPREIAETEGASMLALAGSSEERVIFWTDGQGILAQRLGSDGEAERLVTGRGIRDLAAESVGGSVALAWSRRDLGNGRTRHWLRWRGEDRLLLDVLQPYDLSLVGLPSGPAVLIARREESGNVLRLIRWDGEETVVRRSDLSLVRYGARHQQGVTRVIWLEGFNHRGAVGFSSADWTAYLTELGDGDEIGPTVELGPASYQGQGSQTALGLHGDAPVAMWPGPDGRVLVAGPGEEALNLGQGIPLGVRNGFAYWAERDSIRRRSLAEGSEVENVAWSPMTVLRGELLAAGSHTFLAWQGPTRGGHFRIVASDDLAPLRPGLRDRVAATFGWSPWAFWQALFGQILGSLFAGVLLAMALSPLLWLVSMLVVRLDWARNPTWPGIGSGTVMLLILLILAAARSQLSPASHRALFGGIAEWSAALLLAVGMTWLLRRRSDSEQLIGVLGSAWLFVFVAGSVLAFITFQAWLEYWSSVV